MIKLCVLLGNPGKQYADTRHNAAWLMGEKISFYSTLVWNTKFNGEYSHHKTGGEPLYFLKPGNFMNKSGESVLKIKQFFKLQTDEIVVVHDDLETRYGTVEWKKGGGLGGHNGLRSISNILGDPNFYRFKLGISRPAVGSVSSYVLSRFSQEEEMFLPDYMLKAAGFIEEYLTGRISLTKCEKRILIN